MTLIEDYLRKQLFRSKDEIRLRSLNGLIFDSEFECGNLAYVLEV